MVTSRVPSEISAPETTFTTLGVAATPSGPVNAFSLTSTSTEVPNLSVLRPEKWTVTGIFAPVFFTWSELLSLAPP